jgi:hypothetical protein
MAPGRRACAAFMMSSARISPPGPEPFTRGDVHAVLARQPARLGRNLRARNGRGLGCGFDHRGRRGGGGRRVHLAAGLLGRTARRGHRLAGLQQPRDHLPHGDDVIDLRGHAGEHAVDGGLDLDDGLVGLDFEQDLALLDLLAFLLLPRNELAVSCAISSAGITTLVGINPLANRLTPVRY